MLRDVLNVAMAPAYQIIEIHLDADGNELQRLPAWSFDTLEKAINRIDDVLARYPARGFDKDGNYWWVTEENGDRTRFIVEGT